MTDDERGLEQTFVDGLADRLAPTPRIERLIIEAADEAQLPAFPSDAVGPITRIVRVIVDSPWRDA
jgi:hypothetical protein